MECTDNLSNNPEVKVVSIIKTRSMYRASQQSHHSNADTVTEVEPIKQESKQASRLTSKKGSKATLKVGELS